MIRASVIIPTRDRAAIVPETLDALARQSFPTQEMEVIMVDDGSGDDTERRVCAKTYPFRFVYERLEPQAGFCPARPRNHGLRAATGEVVLFLDADVLAGRELVAQHVAAQEM